MLKCNANPDSLSGIKNTILCTSIFTLFLLVFASPSFAQVGINTDNSAPDASAILDIKSTTKGMLVPRMTTGQRTAISSPATGLLVFDTEIGSFWFYNGTTWEDLGDVETSDHIADADADTKIQVEESADEDKIRFDIDGTEFGHMDGTTFHLEAPGSSLFIGTNAGQNDDGSNNNNTFIGVDAGHSNITGEDNTANGYEALYNNTTGNYNTGNGYKALVNNTTGSYNTANGNNALYSNTTGNNNTSIGNEALYDNTTGNDNTALGHQADVGSGGLSNATAIGANALVSQSNSLVLGNNVNVGIGTSSPNETLDVDGNASIDGSTFYVDDFNDRVGIGTSSPAQTLDVNGNASIDGSTFIVDDVNNREGIGVSSPNHKLHVVDDADGQEVFVAKIMNTANSNSTRDDGLLIQAGHDNYNSAKESSFIQFETPSGNYCGRIKQSGSTAVEYFSVSDRRLKENIQPTRFGLSNLLKIEVRDYNYKTDHSGDVQTGFIAQQLYTAYPPAVGIGGEDVETKPWEVAYGSMTPLLVQAVQDQQKVIEKQQADIEALKRKNKEYVYRLVQIEAALLKLKTLNSQSERMNGTK